MSDWDKYTEALRRCCVSAKLAAFHTKACAEAAERTSIQADLASFFITDYLSDVSVNRGKYKVGYII